MIRCQEAVVLTMLVPHTTAHGAVHDAFMTLPHHTRTSEGDLTGGLSVVFSRKATTRVSQVACGGHWERTANMRSAGERRFSRLLSNGLSSTFTKMGSLFVKKTTERPF